MAILSIGFASGHLPCKGGVSAISLSEVMGNRPKTTPLSFLRAPPAVPSGAVDLSRRRDFSPLEGSVILNYLLFSL
jgi:hypothetical protein